MELKQPIKKGYKTPRYKPPLPFLIETPFGIGIDEYEWPLFLGHYNGTSVIIDEQEGILTLTNKGFFGKGSLSRGCPNLGKRKISNNVVYESQWKRRKQWVENLNKLLENKTSSDNTMVLDCSESEVEVVSIQISNTSTEKKDYSDNIGDNTVVLDCSDESEVEVVLSTEKKNDSNNTGSKEIKCTIDTSKQSNDKNIEVDLYLKKKNESGTNFENNQSIVDDKKVDRNSDHKEVTLNMQKTDQHSNSSNSNAKGNLSSSEVLVISDIHSDMEPSLDNLNPRIEEEKIKTVIEVLYLSLEEAFFLSYACNCIQVVDLRAQILQIREMWELFQAAQSDFIEKYVAYHYFRAKGWVVKTGTKFGGDFLLYKRGPLHFHASYIVIVESLKPGENVNRLTWQDMFGMNRMAESATKEILICQVIWPDVPKDKLKDPSILKEFQVYEMVLRRWQPAQEKDNK